MPTSDSLLEAALAASSAARLPEAQVSPSQGKLLHLLARMQGARRILEIGTLGGYSTIWLARALPPGGHLITVEADANHARIARANIARAGLTRMVELRLGRALDILPKLANEQQKPFDFIFIDADKVNNAEYFSWSLRLAHQGTAILIDNVVRGGKVIDEQSTDMSIEGVQRLNKLIANEPRVTATAVQTVGSKGYDGFILALVTSDA
ncbi:MAG: O-methyltransferase [Anaerolineae bacterium]|nr:O-methyltransferase [Anaerolineae bacterium]